MMSTLPGLVGGAEPVSADAPLDAADVMVSTIITTMAMAPITVQRRPVTR
jgi:hypothetical protein